LRWGLLLRAAALALAASDYFYYLAVLTPHCATISHDAESMSLAMFIQERPMDTRNTKIVAFVACFIVLPISHSAFAASYETQQNSALSSLAGAAVPTAQLGAVRARGDVIVSAVNNGTVSGNTIAGNTTTGTITDIQSINNNSGITTIFQNTGNNSLFQNSTSVYISLH